MATVSFLNHGQRLDPNPQMEPYSSGLVVALDNSSSTITAKLIN